MNGIRSFAHALDMRHSPRLMRLQTAQAPEHEAMTYARACALLELLYQCGNEVPVASDVDREVVRRELWMPDQDACGRFLLDCVATGWLDADAYGRGSLSNGNVREQLEYKSAQAAHGSRRGKPRKTKTNQAKKGLP